MTDPDKYHLGDAVYYQFDGDGVTLTTSDGLHDTNKIYLEQKTITTLLKHLALSYDRAKLREALRKT